MFIDLHIQRSVKSFTITINFADCKNVANAFAGLINIFTEEIDHVKFKAFRVVCLTQVNRRFRVKFCKPQMFITFSSYFYGIHCISTG